MLFLVYDQIGVEFQFVEPFGVAQTLRQKLILTEGKYGYDDGDDDDDCGYHGDRIRWWILCPCFPVGNKWKATTMGSLPEYDALF